MREAAALGELENAGHELDVGASPFFSPSLKNPFSVHCQGFRDANHTIPDFLRCRQLRAASIPPSLSGRRSKASFKEQMQ